MHHLILVTAMSATTGLFGGGKHCGGKMHHARAASACPTATYAMPAPCGSAQAPTMTYAPASSQMAPAAPAAPVQASPGMVPPAPTVPPAPVAPPVPPPASTSNYLVPTGRTYVYQAAYGPVSAPCPSCATR